MVLLWCDLIRNEVWFNVICKIFIFFIEFVEGEVNGIKIFFREIGECWEDY